MAVLGMRLQSKHLVPAVGGIEIVMAVMTLQEAARHL